LATSVQSEDIVFLIDTSISMHETDYGQINRFNLSIDTMRQIIEEKIKIDPKDRYAAVTFAGLNQAMDDMVYSVTEVMNFIQEQQPNQMETGLGEGLSEGIQVILKQMRFIGQKQNRILILTDGLAQMAQVNPINVAKIANHLGIIIDVIRFGPAQIPGNISKKLAEITSGDYIYIGSVKDLPNAIKKIAQKKEKKHTTLFDKSDENDVMAQELLGEIADIPLQLEKMTEDQKDQAIYKIEKGKKIICTICYSNNCMIGKASFFGCGRFCPNCLTPFHLHCAKMWSEQQSKSGKSSMKLFRCPHCFYLLKIPGIELQKEARNNSKDPMISKISSMEIDLDNALCNSPDCGVIIDPNTESSVYKCSACNSYYHLDCARETWQKSKRCAYCEKLVNLED
jgi:Mg-chelatase subunit ChlD